MKRVFHIDLDCFFVAVERLWEPGLVGKPVVVGGRGWRGVVACASYEARRYGIAAGMPLVQARRLCPQAIFLEGRFARYQEASEGFFSILSRYTPFIEQAGIDEAYLDMTGFESLYGSPLRAARLIKEEVRSRLGLTASVGIASSRLVAKVASDLSKPDGLVEVPSGGEAAFLVPLPVSSLPGVGPRTEERLRELGVETIGALATLPLPLLRRLFGAWGNLLHRSARGIDPSPVAPPPEARSVSRSTTLMEDTLDRAFLEAVLGYLAERVGAELRRLERLARVVMVRVRYSDFETLQRQCHLPQATCCHQRLFEVGRGLLGEFLARRSQPVRLVGIGASALVNARQLALWGDGEERLQALNRALDRLRGRYGFAAIQTGRTFSLQGAFPEAEEGYLLTTPALAR